MIAYLVGFVLLGLLSGVNLLLAFGLVRRIREHSTAIARLVAGSAPSSAGAIAAVGTQVRPFRTLASDGTTVSRDGLDGTTLVGFFAPGCVPCEALLPRFLDVARGFAGRTIVVVLDEGDTRPLLSALAPVANVVVEPRGGDLAAAFDVTAYPATCVLDADGRVQSVQLTVPVTA